jgi:hypothetical protein
MGCVHTHQGTIAIKGWGSPIHIQNIVEKTMEVNQKFVKIGKVMRQTSTFGSKHDKIQVQWALNIPLEIMLEMYDGVDDPKWNFEIEPFVVQ